mmetsp:Transcript_103142/g.280275  ORF Transcript_103142/g.280275 Transcript_103142/m.280275 type:complete len:94 (+) Transcript_103142:2623-2904(+)
MNAPRHAPKCLSCHPVCRLRPASAGAPSAAGTGSIRAPFSGSSAGSRARAPPSAESAPGIDPGEEEVEMERGEEEEEEGASDYLPGPTDRQTA